MRILRKELENRIVDNNKLLEYGFILEESMYQYKKYILNDKFKILVNYNTEIMTSKIIDVDNNEEYQLVDIPSAQGEFIGKVREEYENIINDIILNCTTLELYDSEQAKQIITYIKDKYGDELEHLWKRTPKNAIWRHTDNRKWYAALLVIEENKLGIDSNEIITVLDLKAREDFIEKHIDNKKYFPGYHMNKKHWFTIKLDGIVELGEIYRLIDESYNIT